MVVSRSSRRAEEERTYAEGDLGGEESDSLVGVEGRLDVGALDNVLVTAHGLEEGIGEDGSGCRQIRTSVPTLRTTALWTRLTVSHGEGGGSRSVLGLDDLVSSELDPLDEVGESVSSGLDNLLSVGVLGEEGDDRGTCTSSSV